MLMYWRVHSAFSPILALSCTRLRLFQQPADLNGQAVSDHAKGRLGNATVGGRPPETFCAGIKRTAGSHPKERVSGGLPRNLAHAQNCQSPRPKTVCQMFGLVCGIPFAGTAPCGPLYSQQRVSRRRGLDWSRLFGFGERKFCPSHGAGKIKTEILRIIDRRFLQSPTG